LQGLAGTAPTAPTIKTEPEASNPHEKTFQALKKDIKTVLLQATDTVTTLKVFFKDCEPGKHTQTLLEDIKKCIPKWGTAVKKLEGLHVNKCEDEATLLAMAKDLDLLYDGFYDIDTWHSRLCGSGDKPKKRSRKS
jgi:hypothetical protein